MGEPGDAADRIIDAALALAAERPWRRVRLADVAERAGVPDTALYRLFPTRAAIVAAYSRRLDAEIEAAPVDGAGSPRERLFDVVMTRVEALGRHREAALALLAGGPEPSLLAAAPQLLRSMGRMLDAAGVPSRGLAGVVRAKLLLGVYLATLRAWRTDDGSDLGATMAALDRALDRAEPWLRLPPAGAAVAGDAAPR